MRTAPRVLGRSLASMLVENHLVPNLWDDSSYGNDDDTLSLADSALEDDLDVVWINHETANSGNDSTTRLPQTAGDPTFDVNIQEITDSNNGASIVENRIPLYGPSFDELESHSCHTNKSGTVHTLHRRRCHSVDDPAFLLIQVTEQRRH
jgi:hypothetical protein